MTLTTYLAGMCTKTVHEELWLYDIQFFTSQ